MFLYYFIFSFATPWTVELFLLRFPLMFCVVIPPFIPLYSALDWTLLVVIFPLYPSVFCTRLSPACCYLPPFIPLYSALDWTLLVVIFPLYPSVFCTRLDPACCYLPPLSLCFQHYAGPCLLLFTPFTPLYSALGWTLLVIIYPLNPSVFCTRLGPACCYLPPLSFCFCTRLDPAGYACVEGVPGQHSLEFWFAGTGRNHSENQELGPTLWSQGMKKS